MDSSTEAGAVTARVHAQQRTYRLQAGPFREFDVWPAPSARPATWASGWESLRARYEKMFTG